MEHDYMAKVEHMDRGKYMNMKEAFINAHYAGTAKRKSP
jgi:hypothetical protein